MSDLIPNVAVSTFPSGASYTVQQFADAFAARLTLTIPSTSVILGQLGGSEPLSPLPGNGNTPGLWLNGNVLYAWNTEALKYLPLPPVAGQIVDGVIYITEFRSGAHTANTVLRTPDRSGTIALTDDTLVSLGTQTPVGTSVTVDWTIKRQVYLILTGNTTIISSGQGDGQYQDFWVENNATSYTAAWTGVIWPAGSAPTVTTASAGQRRIDHIRLYQVGENTFGEAVKQNYQIGTGTDSTPPSPLTIEGILDTIFVTFDELIQGGDMGTTNFVVKKGTTVQTINAASAAGDTVTITLSATFGANANLTVRYIGSTIKDLSGNLAAAFGPSAVTVTTSAGTGTPGGPPDDGVPDDSGLGGAPAAGHGIHNLP